jgi:dCMP deaminase
MMKQIQLGTIGNHQGPLVESQRDSWDQVFLRLAKEVASWSKDPSTKVGAVAVGPKRNVLAQGYNGFPRGIFDYAERYNDKPTKYMYVVHAEMNVIYNATYNGVSLDGASLYVYGLPPCSECAKGIIQVGIKEIITETQGIPKKWEDSWNFSKSMFDEAGIAVRTIERQ